MDINWAAVGSSATALVLLINAGVFAFHLIDRRRDRRARHRYLAERISCWVEDRYERSRKGLVRHTVVHARNVGDQPVYGLSLVVGQGFVERKVQSLGPLGVPDVPVLAPGADESWSVDEALKAHEVTAPLHVEVTFRDPANTWWRREFSGVLTEVKKLGLINAPEGEEATAVSRS